jgi:ribosomal protein S18 acetylase RimI-like enzyme
MYSVPICAASTLIWQVVQYASAMPLCKAVFLHVIEYNTGAIMFYKRNRFQCIRRLVSFYQINSQNYDAFLYVYYVNGGSPPYSPL